MSLVDRIKRRVPQAADPDTKAHLDDLVARITKVLDTSYTTPPTPVTP